MNLPHRLSREGRINPRVGEECEAALHLATPQSPRACVICVGAFFDNEDGFDWATFNAAPPCMALLPDPMGSTQLADN